MSKKCNYHGELYQVKVANVTTVSYSYSTDGKFLLLQETYANDDVIRYAYNENDDVTAQYHNSNAKAYVTYTYNDDGELTEKVNTDTGLKYVYDGDNVSVYRTSDDTLVQSYVETEDETQEYTTVTENHFGNGYSSVVKDNSVSYTTGSNTVEYSYQTDGTDENEKVSSDTVKYNYDAVISASYTYDDNSNVLSKSYGSNTFTNTYDDKDRIASTSYAGKTVNYAYDTNGQLVSANDDTYEYDSRGNITSKTVNDETTTFTYANSGWKDQLIKVNDEELTYDEVGNVLTYGDREYTWNTGRNLESITEGDNTYSYTYDENGIRTSKTVNGVTTYFNTKDGVILSQTDGTNTMYFQYDTNGMPLGFVLNGTQYFYLTNQMGDVIAIADTEGNIVGNYEYDAWGKVTLADTEIAQQNPIRYRGYYYDIETGYYYLQSRYYDASICRFINADNADVVKDFKNIYNGTNIYSYCLNNATNSFDVNGHVTVNLKNKKISNVIVKFVRKLMSSWNVTSSVNSKKYLLKSVCGVTLYIGASTSTSLYAMKNNVSAGDGNVKVSNKCSLSYKKAMLSYSTTTTYKNNTLKAVVTLGTTAITYGLSLITKYFYTSRASCYCSIDLGLRISHWTTAAATVVVAGVCVAAPYIAPAVGKIYTSVLSSISSYKAFIRALTAIASAGMTVATKLA